MALDDYLDSQVAVAVAATAAVLSPRVRGVLRRGAVYGVAGVLTVGDALGGFARSVGHGAQRATADAAPADAATTAETDSATPTATTTDAARGAEGATRATAPDVADAALTTGPDAPGTTSGPASDGDDTPTRTRKTPRAATHA